MQANILKDTLLFGNNKLSLIEPPPNTAVKGPAYSFTRDQILDFLRGVIADPKGHGVKYETKDTLQRIYDKIVKLSAPDGTDYLNPTPKQHILRKHHHTGELRVIQFKITPELLAYWSPHDLLGLFLSSIPAPNAAQWCNFYVPLLYVYGRWAARLGSSWGVGGTGDEPYMTQATWYGNPDNLRYHLGCSMAGYSKEGDQQTQNKWRRVVGLSRYDILDFVDKGIYTFDKSPNVVLKGYTGTKFGNCAETYPFATFFRGRNDDAQHIWGVALSKEAYKLDTYNDKVLDKVFNPCENCTYLIGALGGHLPNFVWVDYIKALQQGQAP